MDTVTNKFNAKYLIFTLLIAFVLQTLSCANINDHDTSNDIVDVEFLKTIDSLKNQLIQEGSEFKNVAIKFISKTNRYVVADENIKKNSNISRIPFKSLSSIKHPLINKFCRSLNLTEFSSSEKLFENQTNCLYLFILTQLQNPDPSFKHYIESIPKNFQEFPQFFMEAELPKLKNSFMLNRYYHDNAEIKVVFDLSVKANIRKLDNSSFTFDEVKHAYIAVKSRIFGVILKNENKLYDIIVPYTHMYNWDPKFLNTQWRFRIADENDFFILRAAKDIAKGEQVFLFYGLYDNQKLFFDFGFTLEKNSFPLSTDNFVYTHEGSNYTASLFMKETKNLIEMVKDFRQRNKNRFNIKKGKMQMKNSDLKVFKSALESLKKYSNKDRIEEYRRNIKKNSNNENIYRILKDEDQLIDANIKHLGDIIEILEGGKQKLKEKAKTLVVKDNLKYFEDLLH